MTEHEGQQCDLLLICYMDGHRACGDSIELHAPAGFDHKLAIRMINTYLNVPNVNQVLC